MASSRSASSGFDSSGKIKVIRVASGEAAYEVAIGPGLLQSLHSRVVELTGGKPAQTFLITSPKIWKLWSKQVRASFPEAQSPTVLFHPAGEKHKRFADLEPLAEQLAGHGADRDSVLIAFGGGVIGDITGFLAAIYMRGIAYVQVPTTLLAQVDSSVGGKTGVNLAAGKNLVGSFHHPLAVFAESDLLSTLPGKELRAGLQESVKAAIIRSAGLFAALELKAAEMQAGEPGDLAADLVSIVAESVVIKAEIVAQDEREAGPRMLLNFGHTLGHAIEATTEYKQLLHGEAVGWGMIGALHLSLARGRITAEEFARMANLVLAFGPLPRFKAKAEELVRLTATDKKTRSGRRAFVVATGIGSAEVVYDVSDDELSRAAKAMLKTVRAAGKKRA